MKTRNYRKIMVKYKIKHLMDGDLREIGKFLYRRGKAMHILLFLGIALILTGCVSPSKQYGITDPAPGIDLSPAGQTEYILCPGDTISISFFYFPRLDATVKIRPDGYISLVPLDDVKAAGLIAKELDELLTKLYADRIENPELTVTVREFSSQKVYVGGEVKNAGIYELEAGMTPLQALFKAGGALKTGNLETVIVIRKENDNTPRVYSLNLEREIRPGEGMSVFFLQPLDVVYVPETLIAQLNQFVDQYIDKMIPISLNAGFSYVIGEWNPR
ncbi:MAG: polysaccharide biosynthesis/export family protein [Thermodesulfovibrionales bacterium]|nr:polysaccharide biosynthesis/export family protein [Thermodesulfovibrionales bacterium]